MHFRRSALATLLVLALPAIAAAQTGMVTGRVATPDGIPLADSRVFLVGTSTYTTTNVEGRYTLRNVPAGRAEVRVIRVGYQEQKKPVTVNANGSATLDFAMEQAVVKLAEIVTTATGEQRKVELGHSITTLGDIAQHVETSPIKNLADLMVAKAPGVIVLPGNMTGSSPIIRIRGMNSLSLSNEPIYVIDGVRMSSSTLGLGTGGTTVSYLNMLNPDEIEDIEIVKGPSAATLYGTAAANGVVVITTKKGKAGNARWTWHAEGGAVKDRNDYPAQYANWGHAPATPSTPARCILVTIAANTCVQDSVTHFDLLREPGYTPKTTGSRHQGGVQVTGGTDVVRYFVTTDLERELGPLKMPEFSRRFLDSTGNKVRDEWLYPESFKRNAMRMNLTAAVNPKFDLNVNAGYTKTDQRLPQVDNNSFSYIYNAFQNPGFKPNFARCSATPVNCLGYTDKGGLGEELGGYGFFTPGNIFQVLNNLDVDRFIASATGQWRPVSWMQNEGTVGTDLANRDGFSICRFGECPASGQTRLGSVSDNRTADRNLSAKLVSTSSWQFRPEVNFRTTVGADYVNLQTEFASSNGSQLPPGAQSVGQAAVRSGNSSLPRADKTLGYYLQEQLSLRDRLFLTIAARTDQNSAFGTNFQRVVYPKASISYIISDEPFFPKFDFLSQLRLRAAYGASGVQPGSTAALQTFASSTVNVPTSVTATSGTDTPGLVANALGNPDLKPERSTEREMGFETRLFSNKVNFDFTYYNKLTKDALYNKPIAASSGASDLNVLQNLASVRNSGLEVQLNTTLIDRRNLGFDVTVSASHNTNKVESLGQQPCTVVATDPTCVNGFKSNPTNGTGANRDSVGMPYRGVYARPFTFTDANNDGIISSNEVTVDPGFVYLGYSYPRDLISIQPGLELFGRRLRVSGLLDYKGGYSIFNNTVSFYCQQTFTCFDETNKTASLYAQARSVAQRYANPTILGAVTSNVGYYENGQFWRLRELSATLQVPNQLATRMRARDASLTFSARNVHIWTKYTGSDPESNYGTGDVQQDFSTTAPPSYFTVRLNLHY
jgi:TonB-linked SusC/RagA family outer membrane protein